MKTLLGLLLPFACASGMVAADTAPPTTRPFVKQMEYWLRDGGEWRCDNPDYKPGSDQAKEFGYEFSWALHKRAVSLEIFGDYDDGNRITFWLNVSAWHPVDKRVVMTHLGVGGAVLSGYEIVQDETTREHVFTGVAPDGSEMKFRDIARITGPDTHESTSYQWKDGEWVAQRTLHWHRAKPTPVAEADDGKG